MKLNIGCGNDHLEGYVNVDIRKGCNPDQVWDVTVLPWPCVDGEFDEIKAHGILEHLPLDKFIPVVDECYRVLKPGGILWVSCPWPWSAGQIHDPTHTRALLPITFQYFSKEWREKWGFTHYPITANFEAIETPTTLTMPGVPLPLNPQEAAVLEERSKRELNIFWSWDAKFKAVK